MAAVRVALVLAVTFALAPIVGLFASVPPPEALAALRDPDAAGAARTSLEAAALALAVATFLGVPAGYLAARATAALRTLLLFVFALPLALPPVASGIALLGLFGRHRPVGAFLEAHGVPVVDAFAGVAIAQYDVAGSLVAVAATAAFSGVDPALEDAARTLGASRLRAMLTIAVPLAAPGLAAGILLAFLRALGEYGATAMLAYHPTSLPIQLATTLESRGFAPALALAEAFVAFAGLAVLAASLLQRRSR